jgi:hypothetical protein
MDILLFVQSCSLNPHCYYTLKVDQTLLLPPYDKSFTLVDEDSINYGHATRLPACRQGYGQRSKAYAGRGR